MIKHRFIRSAFLVILVSFASFMYAEALPGKVTDSETGEPLVGAQVFVKGTFVGTTTDVNGSYSLNVDGSETVVSHTLAIRLKSYPLVVVLAILQWKQMS